MARRLLHVLSAAGLLAGLVGFPAAVASAGPSTTTAAAAPNATPACTRESNPFTQAAPAVSPDARYGVSDDYNWAGYVVHPASGDSFRQAYLKWTEPTASASSDSRLVGIWPGIGSGKDGNHLLIQAGTGIATGPGSVSHAFWYEWVGGSKTINPRYLTLPVTGGNQVSVTVTYYPPHQGFSALVDFNFHNITKGKSCYVEVTPPGLAGGQAETITERVTSGVVTFAKFTGSSRFRLNSATAASHCVGNWSNTRIDATKAGGDASSSNPVVLTERFNQSSGCSAHWYRP
jgi:hypothetical protein